MRLNPYLHFNGNCKEAFEFYAEVFHSKAPFLMTHGAAPTSEQAPPGWEDKIMHATVDIGGTSLYGADAPPTRYTAPSGFSVSISIGTIEDSERIFAGLSPNARIDMPLQETFWAHRFGMLTDRFGTPWMINCEKPMPAN